MSWGNMRIMSSAIAGLMISGCATTFESSCAELAYTNQSQLKSMVRTARKRNFESHVILLETGSELSDKCRSHYIDKKTYDNRPSSLNDLCEWQSTKSDKYCQIYYLDGKAVKETVY